jgi:hypothetical protein
MRILPVFLSIGLRLPRILGSPVDPTVDHYTKSLKRIRPARPSSAAGFALDKAVDKTLGLLQVLCLVLPAFFRGKAGIFKASCFPAVRIRTLTVLATDSPHQKKPFFYLYRLDHQFGMFTAINSSRE